MDEKLIYKKSITKSLDSYVKTTPPHVKAARKLDKLESKRIEYYVTSDGPEPIQKLKHKINYDHYIEKQIKPVADSILLLLETNFSEIVQKTKQIKLF
jgi:DNA polymerase-2